MRWWHWSGVTIFCHGRDNSTGQKAQDKYFSFISDRADSQQSTWKDNTIDIYIMTVEQQKPELSQSQLLHLLANHNLWKVQGALCRPINPKNQQDAGSVNNSLKLKRQLAAATFTVLACFKCNDSSLHVKGKGDVKSADNTKLRNWTFTESYCTKPCCILCVWDLSWNCVLLVCIISWTKYCCIIFVTVICLFGISPL